MFGIIHLSLSIFGKQASNVNQKISIYQSFPYDDTGPVVGKYLPIWGPRILYPAGFILDGLSFIVFGLLHWLEDTNIFLVLSYLIRVMEGVGAAATWNSNLSILMAKFPQQKASVKAWCDASFNLGLTLGPVLGAFMYEAGGFFLPFVVTGSAIIISGAAVYLVTDMPEIQRSETGSRSVLSFLARPSITGALLTVTIAAYTIGTIEATLATFLRVIPGITVRKIAIVFLAGPRPLPLPSDPAADPRLGLPLPSGPGGRKRSCPYGQLQLRTAVSCQVRTPRSCRHSGRGGRAVHLGLRRGQLLRADALWRAV